MYEKLSDKLLFEYFMMHSTRKEDIYCKAPFYLTDDEFAAFKSSSETLNSLVYRIMSGIKGVFKDFQGFIPEFKYKDEIINLKRPMSEVFWVRYDGFLRANGGVFYSEFNYDKPCAEREIIATGDMEAYNNINIEYRHRLIESVKKLMKRHEGKGEVAIALLADPCHYEESHLMCLLQKELACEQLNFIRVGPSNLYVEENKVYAFGKCVDIIIRLFPTEYSSEIKDFDKILEVFEGGSVDIVNDPRVIIGQCKNLYTYLWQLVRKRDIRLKDVEVKAIEASLPYTEVFSKDMIQELIDKKDKFVVKPVYGRYSIDVFIGKLHNEEDWKKALNYVSGSGKQFIIQEFCEIKESDTYYTPEGNFLFPVKAFANIGCFMLEHEFSGCCVRWSDDYLTTDDYTWITPIGIKSKVLEVKQLDASGEARKKLWDRVTERGMFEGDFTGRYVKNFQYIGLDYLNLERNKYRELIFAVEAVAKIMDKTQKLVYTNLRYFAPILGIEQLEDILSSKFTEEFLFLGRMDWAIDNSGQLKLLEINAETPAGLAESLYIDRIITEELGIKEENPNVELRSKIVDQFKKIVNDYSKTRSIQTIGVLTSTYYEDWYTAKSLYKVLSEEMSYDFVIGSIYDCRVDSTGKLNLYGKSLDAVYRYYPLDWFDKEEMSDKKDALKNTLSINPAHTIISQSKAFFAVMYELLKQGFYSEEEKAILLKYIPKTSFQVEELNSYDYLVKPILSREGKGIALACELQEIPDEDYIYQQRVDTINLNYEVYSNISGNSEVLYPILGTYVAGTKFAGIYTRLGRFITENLCIYAPVRIGGEHGE